MTELGKFLGGAKSGSKTSLSCFYLNYFISWNNLPLNPQSDNGEKENIVCFTHGNDIGIVDRSFSFSLSSV